MDVTPDAQTIPFRSGWVYIPSSMTSGSNPRGHLVVALLPVWYALFVLHGLLRERLVQLLRRPLWPPAPKQEGRVHFEALC